MNSLIRHAHWMSPLGLWVIWSEPTGESTSAPEIFTDPDVIAAKKEAIEKLMDHVLTRHATGWLMVLLVGLLLGNREMMIRLQRLVVRLFNIGSTAEGGPGLQTTH